MSINIMDRLFEDYDTTFDDVAYQIGAVLGMETSEVHGKIIDQLMNDGEDGLREHFHICASRMTNAEGDFDELEKAVFDMQNEVVCMRVDSASKYEKLGASSEYESFDSPEDAAMVLGALIADIMTNIMTPEYLKDESNDSLTSDDIDFNFKGLGVEIKPYFEGKNYVSLYWGDAKFGYVRELEGVEQDVFYDSFISIIDDYLESE